MTTPSTWTRSTHCGGSGTCVWTARTPGAVHVQDARRGPTLALTPQAFRALLDAAKEAR